MYHIFTLKGLLVSLIHHHQTYLINGIMTKEELMYDAPLRDPKDDILDRKQFAESFAKSIIGLKAKQEFVYGLYGSWGSGKSTIINFIEHFIDQHNKKSDEKTKVIILRFNPWMFSCTNDLITLFLNQLRARLGMDGIADDLKKVADQLGLIESILSVAKIVVKCIPIPFGNEFIENSKDMISGMKNVAGSTSKVLAKDLHHIKEDIVQQLQNQENKILIIIDDLDRLLDEEVKNLMKMIKAVCDFPQIIYLLACDSKKVADSLGSSDTNGHNYLEKIVQCSFNVPPPSRDKLNKLFLQNLEQIFELSQNKDLLFDKIEWGNLFYDAVSPSFKTPRNVKALINSIRAHYPAVQDEVNITDFIGVQVLRVFYPNAYTMIDDNSEFLTGWTDGADVKEKQAKDFYEQIHNQVSKEDLEHFKKLMSRLFPKYKAVHDNFRYGSDWLQQEWQRKRKVCSKECFDIYFTLFISEEVFTLNKMREIIALADSQSAFESKLRSFIEHDKINSKGRYKAFLNELTLFITEIPREKIQPLLQVIYDLSDEVPRDDNDSSFIPLDIHTNMLLISSKLTERLEQEQKMFELLKTIFENSKSISMIVQQTNSIYSQKEQNIVTSEHAEALASLALKRLKEFISNKDKEVPKVAIFVKILYCWQKWESKDMVQKYIKELINTEQGAIDFITAFLTSVKSYSANDSVMSSKDCVPHKDILEFIEESELELLVQKARNIIINNSDLKERPQKALKAFIDQKDNPNNYLL